MCVLHHPFSKSGHFFAISTKRVTVSVPVSKFSLLCLDNDGKRIIFLGKKKPVSIRMVIAMQVKRSHRKGCLLSAVYISNDKGKDVEDEEVLNNYPNLQHFRICFLQIFWNYHLIEKWIFILS